jgi:hypothetical protein
MDTQIPAGPYALYNPDGYKWEIMLRIHHWTNAQSPVPFSWAEIALLLLPVETERA